MSQLLFRLNGVGEDEAAEVRELLDEHHIGYYETSAGRWGLSVAALWLIDTEQLASARRLLADYQQQRLTRLEETRSCHPPAPFTTRFRQAPWHYLLVMAAILIVLGLSIYPFLSLPA